MNNDDDIEIFFLLLISMYLTISVLVNQSINQPIKKNESEILISQTSIMDGGSCIVVFFVVQ